VLREISGEEGSLCLLAEGRPAVHAPFSIAPDQITAAAFFDSLIAQQDRHAGNYRWDSQAQRLWLIDHGFSFARPGDLLNATIFVEFRWALQHEALTRDEQISLDI